MVADIYTLLMNICSQTSDSRAQTLGKVLLFPLVPTGTIPLPLALYRLHMLLLKAPLAATKYSPCSCWNKWHAWGCSMPSLGLSIINLYSIRAIFRCLLGFKFRILSAIIHTWENIFGNNRAFQPSPYLLIYLSTSLRQPYSSTEHLNWRSTWLW